MKFYLNLVSTLKLNLSKLNYTQFFGKKIMKDKTIEEKGTITILVPLVIFSLTLGIAINAQINPDNTQKTDEKLETFSNYKELERFIEAGTSEPAILSITHTPGRRNILWGNNIRKQSGVEPAVEMQSQKSPVSYQIPSSKNTDQEIKSNEHSSTNVQVEGVDEADIIKNDGKHIYAISEKNVIIAKAYPPEKAQISSKIEPKFNPKHLFVNKDKLVVISEKEGYYWKSNSERKIFVEIYDISQRNNPNKIKYIEKSGIYVDSRRINKRIYLITTEPINPDNIHLPKIKTNQQNKTVKPSKINHFKQLSPSYKYTSIIGLDLEKMDLTKETYLMNRAQNLYVSRKNIYITNQVGPSPQISEQFLNKVILPLLPSEKEFLIGGSSNSGLSYVERWLRVKNILKDYLESLDDVERREFLNDFRRRVSEYAGEIGPELEKTSIHKISIGGDGIEYVAKGVVPGRVLNQFSMSEYKGYFRIATTTGHVHRNSVEDSSKNHVFVLNDNLEVVGEVKDLASGERIYSARFMGDKAYLVTFKKVDPLFVIDLKNPQEPEVLGKLKIPGYSNYLHPFGENYLIGIGKSTVASEEGNFAWYKGVKLSLFDISDLNNPKQVSKFIVGDRGTESPALKNHKALLFSKSKNLLAIPIKLAEIKEEKYEGEIPPYARGEYTWQGEYVFKISKESGFTLKGRITHSENKESSSEQINYHSTPSIERALYIENAFYTYSKQKIKINKLKNLSKINELEF